MTKPENQFPTIEDLHSVLTDLIANGYGDLPVQVLAVPNSTLQAVARSTRAPLGTNPALMLEFTVDQTRHPVSILCAAHLDGSAKPHVVQ